MQYMRWLKHHAEQGRAMRQGRVKTTHLTNSTFLAGAHSDGILDFCVWLGAV